LLVEGGRLIFVVVVVVVVYLRKIITIVVSSLSRRRNPDIFSASRRRWLLHRVLGYRRCLVAKKLEESTSDVITFLSRLRVNHVCVLHLVVVVADLLRGYDVAVVFLFLVVLISFGEVEVSQLVGVLIRCNYTKEITQVNLLEVLFGKVFELALGERGLGLYVNVLFVGSELKYLAKKYLKKVDLRDFLRVIASDKNTYQLRYFNLTKADEDDEDEDADE
jgi:hypothetical protein